MRGLAVVIGVATIACGGHPTENVVPAGGAVGALDRPARAVAFEPRIVALGDSLTAGLGIAVDEAYPAVLQRRLNDAGLKYHVINAGVSGDTSAGGLTRLEWALDGNVRILIVALGANDGLRGLPVEELTANLSQIIERAQARGIGVILAGMEAPPNYGRPYAAQFHQVYPTLAKKYHVPLVPFLLQGVAGEVRLNQRDGIHPTPEGARIVADTIWTVLEPIAKQAAVRGNAAAAPRRARGALSSSKGGS
jgi:acyl-CoA thioesterase-1